MNNDNVLFLVGEVVTGYDNTLKYIASGSTSTTNKLFTIQVRVINRFTKQFDVYTCRPFNMNFKQIPLIGEHVLIFRAYSQETTLDGTNIEWYYLNPYSIQSSINANLVPGISYGATISEEQAREIKPGNVFKPMPISPLQPYEGDLIIEGRFGNSIRIGSTVTNQPGLLEATWNGNTIGDPITIISNGQQNKTNKQFVVENIKQDPASIYLTTTQKFPNFYLGTTSKKQPLTKFKSESTFDKSQLLGSADRIILTAKTDIAVIDSTKAIVLNAPKIYMGNDDASEPIPHGKVLYDILNDIISTLNSGTVGTAGVTSQFINTAGLISARKKLNSLLSTNYFIRKG
jgi:hypothetical protein